MRPYSDIRPKRRPVAAARRATEMTKGRFVAEGRRDPSTPEPEASAVATVLGHKTEETARGGEEL